MIKQPRIVGYEDPGTKSAQENYRYTEQMHFQQPEYLPFSRLANALKRSPTDSDMSYLAL